MGANQGCKKTTVIINRQRFHVDDTTLSPEDFRNLVNLPNDYEVWKIIRRPDPEGELPVDDQQVTEAIDVSNGDRFRVVPPGTFGGTS